MRAWIALAGTIVVAAAIVFGSANSVAFWRGWVFLAVFIAASVALTLDLAVRDAALMERRSRGGPWAETRPVQKLVMALMSLGFLALLATPFAWRRGWAPTSAEASCLGDVLIAAGYLAIGVVFRANSFAAATVGVGEEQRVISAGPYAWIRHPMYAASLVYMIGVALALGSWWGLAIVAFMAPLLAWRMMDEERLLERRLPGYRDYMRRVRWRLIPRLF